MRRTVMDTIRAHRMIEHGQSVLVGVSGGPDSLTLLHVLHDLADDLSLRLGVAHLNHGLRADAADREADFVADVAQKLNLPCYVKKVPVHSYRQRHKLSLEEAARKVRYTFYRETADAHGFEKIALGHHADDNAELVLMQLLRGSGPLGIAGIPPVRPPGIIRPLYDLCKSEIYAYLNDKGLIWAEDQSNTDPRFLRNRVRHQLLPELKTDYNANIIHSLHRLAVILRSEEDWIDSIIQPLVQGAVIRQEPNFIELNRNSLATIHLAAGRRVIREAIMRIKGDLRRITFDHIESVHRLLSGPSPEASIDLPDRIRIRLTAESIVISKEKRPLREIPTAAGLNSRITFCHSVSGLSPLIVPEIGIRLTFSVQPATEVGAVRTAGHHIAFFDMEKVEFPLIVRNACAGDRFYPLGMTGSQKLNNFFINRKIPRAERVRCPLLVSRDRIIWVIGHRIDHSVRVQSSTRKILKVELFLA